MDRDQFWQIIEAARVPGRDDAGEVAEAVVEHLIALPVERIAAFERQQDRVLEDGYRWDLWAAAYVINGGTSDDGFDYFRGWLMAQGRAVWERALADPDSLADVTGPQDTGEAYCEDMIHVVYDAHRRATGSEDLPPQDEEPEWRAPSPVGEHFDFDDDEEMSRRLPRLFAIFRRAAEPLADAGPLDGA